MHGGQQYRFVHIDVDDEQICLFVSRGTPAVVYSSIQGLVVVDADVFSFCDDGRVLFCLTIGCALHLRVRG